MFAYVVKRLIAGFFVVILVSMSIFALFWYGPEEPARPLCNLETSQRCTPERLETYTESMGYNNPIHTEYLKFMKGIVAGRDITIASRTQECPAPCFGFSYATDRPVWGELKERLPATVSVALGGAALYVIFGVPIGIAAARRRGSLTDKVLVSTFLVISSVPYYLFALMLWLYVTLVWQVPGLSDTGYVPLSENPAKWAGGLLLPWLALGIFGSTQYTRFARGSMIEALSEDYIRTAKAKGLRTRAVVYRHGLRAALVPIVTIFGIDLGTLLVGTIFTERIFDIQGIGLWALLAVGDKDLPVVQATALFGAVVMVVCNLLVDLVYSALDPRVRLS